MSAIDDEVAATKKLFRAIKKGVNEILSRDGEKLLCERGICLEVADILGLSVERSLPFIHFHNGGYAVIDPISLVIEKLGIGLDTGIESVSPAGEWTETRERLCHELLSQLDDENFVDEFLESGQFCQINLELFDKHYKE